MIKNRYAEKLIFRGEVYTYCHSKRNILTYIKQPAYYYEDWQENGGILVVQYKENTKNHKYYVLHQIGVREGTGYIEHYKITGIDRIAKEYK